MSIINIKQIAETVIELSHESERNKKEINNLLKKMKELINNERKKYV